MVLHWLKSGYNAVQKALSNTRKQLSTKLKKLFGQYVDEELLEEIEQLLYESDLGVSLTKELIGKIRLYMKNHSKASADEVLQIVETGLIDEMKHLNHTIQFAPSGFPTIILIVGTNGNGKTTSSAKLANLFIQQESKTVLFGACDTFRAGAQEQLGIWAERLNIDIVHGKEKADPAAVAFDAIQKAQARTIDVVILDTAGRLENKSHLLQELSKVRKSCQKASQEAALFPEKSIPHETLLVVDGSTGQNAIEQAKAFHSVTPITGIILTKMDGSAKGGIAIAIQKQLGLPVKYLGIGEKIDNLLPFDPKLFVQAMLYDEET